MALQKSLSTGAVGAIRSTPCCVGVALPFQGNFTARCAYGLHTEGIASIKKDLR
jgi:hypothetical protein